jgi:hypothetical protein
MKRTENFPLSLSTFLFRLTTENQLSTQRRKEHEGRFKAGFAEAA